MVNGESLLDVLADDGRANRLHGLGSAKDKLMSAIRADGDAGGNSNLLEELVGLAMPPHHHQPHPPQPPLVQPAVVRMVCPAHVEHPQV